MEPNEVMISAKELRKLQKRRKARLGDNYHKHGHERLLYHAKASQRAKVRSVEQDADTGTYVAKPGQQFHRLDSLPNSLERPEHDGASATHVATGTEVATTTNVKRNRRLSTREERASGIALYTQHLAQLAHNAQNLAQNVQHKLNESIGNRDVAIDERDKAEVDNNRDEYYIDYGDDWALERLCKAVGFLSESAWLSCWRNQRGKRVRVPEGCPSAAVRFLELDEHQLRNLYRSFNRIDIDGSGSVSVEEFLQYLDTESSAFVRVFIDKIVFEWADLNTDGNLDFGEFILAVSIVCCLSRRELFRFIFEVFDVDESGEIDREEFRKLGHAVVEMGSLFQGNFDHYFATSDVNDDGAIDFEEFVHIGERFPTMFFPVARLQDSFRQHTFSIEFWERKAAKFSKNRNGEQFHDAITALGKKIIWKVKEPPRDNDDDHHGQAPRLSRRLADASHANASYRLLRDSRSALGSTTHSSKTIHSSASAAYLRGGSRGKLGNQLGDGQHTSRRDLPRGLATSTRKVGVKNPSDHPQSDGMSFRQAQLNSSLSKQQKSVSRPLLNRRLTVRSFNVSRSRLS